MSFKVAERQNIGRNNDKANCGAPEARHLGFVYCYTANSHILLKFAKYEIKKFSRITKSQSDEILVEIMMSELRSARGATILVFDFLGIFKFKL